MRFDRPIDNLDVVDWVLLGYLLGIALWWLFESGGDVDDMNRHPGQRVSLSEEHLQRLEDGDSVQVHRWHGHELVLDGSVVVQGVKEDTGDE